MKKPPKLHGPAKADQERQDAERHQQEVMERLAAALRDAKPREKRKPGEPLHNGDPYNTAGPDQDVWNGGKKR